MKIDDWLCGAVLSQNILRTCRGDIELSVAMISKHKRCILFTCVLGCLICALFWSFFYCGFFIFHPEMS